MKAQEYLEQYAEAKRIAERLRAEYEKESELINTVRSALDSDGGPRRSGISRPTEQKAIRLAKKLTLYQDAELDAIAVKRRILRTVNRVPDEMGAVLYERYINLKKWRDVAEAVGYSERQCHNIHDKALEMVEVMIK